MGRDWTIVLDVGKTLSKATLWNEAGQLAASRSRPNLRVHVACGALSLIQRKGPYTPLEPVTPLPIYVIRYREEWRERASHARGWS
jgi:hypothetical protein